MFKGLYFLIIALRLSSSDRRIRDGKLASDGKPYMVYLVKAEKSDKRYDSWLCGGSIVTENFIITSAACVEDVHFMYAIAGYKKYVPPDQINSDQCTKSTKKKIVYICVPKSYDMDYDKVEKWGNIDIAVVKVETPYDFKDESYKTSCSYTPTTIDINYEPKLQEPGTDVLAMGWGHLEKFRLPRDTNNYNQENLHYAATKIISKEKCKSLYTKSPELHSVIDKYMICTQGTGAFNQKGEYTRSKNATLLNGCPLGNGACLRDKADKTRRFYAIQAYEYDSRISDGDKFIDNLTSFSSELYDDDNKEVQKDVGRIKYNESLKTQKGYNRKDQLGIEDVTRRNKLLDTKKPHRPTKPSTTSMPSATSTMSTMSTLSATSTTQEQPWTGFQGICQNDHGGPLTTWLGAQEILIGVASVYRVDKESNCAGPYLFTSTQCNGLFIECVFGLMAGRRMHVCDTPAEKLGFHIIERQIAWNNHSDGISDIEHMMKFPMAINNSLNKEHGYSITERIEYPLKEKPEYIITETPLKDRPVYLREIEAEFPQEFQHDTMLHTIEGDGSGKADDEEIFDLVFNQNGNKKDGV